MHISQIIFIFPTVSMIFIGFKSESGSLSFLHLTQKSFIHHRPAHLAQPLSPTFYPEVALGLKVSWMRMFYIKRRLDIAAYFQQNFKFIFF